ncbi:MAG TPA: sigma-70 family RNA polymerase sigma factor [Vicinamibacteria bacterium]|nr:sigma-70 family RNA polymerase sigma factor [Vicinamibacteria bacterium]
MIGQALSPSLPIGAALVRPPAAGLRVDDREAVLACQSGEREAFDLLVERYQRDIYRLCYRYVNDPQDANDMAQEVFLKAYRAIHRFRGDSSFSTWLYRIAVNTCLNFRSSRRPEGEELPDSLPDKHAGALDAMVEDERASRVREAVSRLPEKQRATLILKIYHELTHEEVAGIVGSSVGTVKANLFHALGNLRKMLHAEAGK